ncbi:MAG: site-2 protease family protein [Patescibacteria group bacterium]
MSFLFNLLVLTLVIIIHEFGHLWLAKKCGVGVNEFSVGMGKLLWSFKRDETLYSLRLIPLGGYCMMDEESYKVSNYRSRMLISFGGPLFNFVAFLVFLIGAFCLIGSNPFEAVINSVLLLFKAPAMVADSMKDTSNLAGPIGILSDTKAHDMVLDKSRDMFASLGFVLASYNLSIGIANLFPFPILDGGHLFRHTIERFIPRSNGFIKWYSIIGNVAFGFLFLGIFAQDIIRLFLGK